MLEKVPVFIFEGCKDKIRFAKLALSLIGWSARGLRKRIGGTTLAAKTKTKTKTRKRTTGVDQRLVKALAHPLRVEILAILNERMASPNELSKELDEGLSQVSYHVKVLKDFKCIEMVKTEPRRGAVEHYYRATARAFLSDSEWKKLPDSIKPGMSAAFVKMIIDDVITALNGGTFDSRDDRHVSWTPGVVDEQGWEESVDLVNETLKQLIAIHAGSAKRLAKSGEEGIPATAVLMNYEGLPPGSKTAPKAKKGKAKRARKKA
jgi:DNA-binding transcriptional ArsR family regulator